MGPWQLHVGLINFKNWVYLKAASPTIEAIITEFHNSTHEGYHKGLQRIRYVFYWLRMRQQRRNFIKNCDICQRHKVEAIDQPGCCSPYPFSTMFGRISLWISLTTFLLPTAELLYLWSLTVFPNMGTLLSSVHTQLCKLLTPSLR